MEVGNWILDENLKIFGDSSKDAMMNKIPTS